MDDKRIAREISLWCFAKDAGDMFVHLPAFPCKQEACPRYQAEYPHCVMMSRFERRGREYP